METFKLRRHVKNSFATFEFFYPFWNFLIARRRIYIHRKTQNSIFDFRCWQFYSKNRYCWKILNENHQKNQIHYDPKLETTCHVTNLKPFQKHTAIFVNSLTQLSTWKTFISEKNFVACCEGNVVPVANMIWWKSSIRKQLERQTMYDVLFIPTQF